MDRQLLEQHAIKNSIRIKLVLPPRSVSLDSLGALPTLRYALFLHVGRVYWKEPLKRSTHILSS